MINGRRIPMNGDPWQNWVTRELKAQREELRAQRAVQREIIVLLDKHERSLRELAGILRGNTLDIHEHTRQIAGLHVAVGSLSASVGRVAATVGALTVSVDKVTASVGRVTASVVDLTATVGTLHERVEGGFHAVNTKLDRILKKLK